MIKPIIELSTNIYDLVNNCIAEVTSLSEWLPSRCQLCRSKVYGSNICDYCDFVLPRLNNKCHRCSWPIISSMFYCELCIPQRHGFSNILVALPYLRPVDRLIHQFKYQADLTKGRLLSQLLLRHLLSIEKLRLPEVIIPVPLSDNKLQLRGFNQSIELGRYLAKHLGIRMDHQLLAKYKNTQAQMGQDKATRKDNIEGSFCFNRRPQYKSVVILDDVVTTGSTVFAIRDLLNNAGITDVSVWAVARRM